MTDITPDDDAPALRPVNKPLRFMTLRAIVALMLRQMASTYGRSPGGYIWAIIQPAATIFIFVALFRAAFRSPSLGTNFAMFYASGYLPYYMGIKLATEVGGTLRKSKALLTFPRVTIFDAVVARMFLEVVTQLMIAFILLALIMGIYDTQTVVVLPKIILAYTMAIALGTGIGILHCFLIVQFTLWKGVWGIMTRPLVIISGVIFMHERVPQPYRGWLEWNPFTHIVSQSRSGFYVSYEPDYIDPVFVFTIAAVCGVVGTLFLRRYHRDLLEL